MQDRNNITGNTSVHTPGGRYEAGLELFAGAGIQIRDSGNLHKEFHSLTLQERAAAVHAALGDHDTFVREHNERTASNGDYDSSSNHQNISHLSIGQYASIKAKAGLTNNATEDTAILYDQLVRLYDNVHHLYEENNQLEQNNNALSDNAADTIIDSLGRDYDDLDNQSQDHNAAKSVFEQSADAQACLISYEGVDMDDQDLIHAAEAQAADDNGQAHQANTQAIQRNETDIADKQAQIAELEGEINALEQGVQTAESDAAQENNDSLEYDPFKDEAAAIAKRENVRDELETLQSGYGGIDPESLALIKEKYGIDNHYINDVMLDMGIEEPKAKQYIAASNSYDLSNLKGHEEPQNEPEQQPNTDAPAPGQNLEPAPATNGMVA